MERSVEIISKKTVMSYKNGCRMIYIKRSDIPQAIAEVKEIQKKLTGYTEIKGNTERIPVKYQYDECKKEVR